MEPEPEPEQEQVREHYQRLQKLPLAQRGQSPLYKMFRRHNWIKAVLLQQYVPPHGARLLDVGGGRGGDLDKFDKLRISRLLMCDIAGESVTEARQRYRRRRRGYEAEFVELDFCTPRITRYWPEYRQFDTVNCQFMIHYAFQNEARLQAFMGNVTDRLVPGGHFLVTTLNAETVRQRLADSSRCGNEYYSIEMLDEDEGRYLFQLTHAITTPCPEWLVPRQRLVAVAEQHGLELLVWWPSFETFFQAHRDSHRDLLQRMCGGGGGGRAAAAAELSEPQHEISSMYCAYVFRRK